MDNEQLVLLLPSIQLASVDWGEDSKLKENLKQILLIASMRRFPALKELAVIAILA